MEGVLCDYFFLDGRYHHAVISSMLASAYANAALTRLDPPDAVPVEDRLAANRILTDYLAATPADVRGRLIDGDPDS